MERLLNGILYKSLQNVETSRYKPLKPLQTVESARFDAFRVQVLRDGAVAQWLQRLLGGTRRGGGGARPGEKPSERDQTAFSKSLICTGACQNSAACGTNVGG